MPGILDDPAAVIGRNQVLQVDPAAQGFRAAGPGGLLGGGLKSGVPQANLVRDPSLGLRQDPYVYHGTTQTNLASIKQGGLRSFLGNYFASDPQIAINYAFTPNIHYPDRGPEGGLLLRVRKADVEPDTAPTTIRDFWRGPAAGISADKIEMWNGNQWQGLK